LLNNIPYVLTWLVLVLGLIVGVGLMTGAANMVAIFLLPLQLVGGEVASNLIAPMLSGFLINLGIVILALAVILSAVLYFVGRLVGHIALLEVRLARLEERA
jgi:hypothetical protein